MSVILALSLFLVFGNQWLLNLYAKSWQPAPIPLNPAIAYSCGIVPGGFASPDADAKGYFNSAADRFIQAVKLYRLGEIKHILISGGNGKDNEKTFREGAWVKGELKAFGIPDSVSFIEDRSNNTQDNAINSKQILDSLNLKPPYLLITSAFHIPRAALIFKRSGINVVPFPCNYTAGRGSFSFGDLVPRPSVLLSWDIYLKEAVGYFWYKMKR
ncbi:MAG: YdcF family protein [Bacteroidota bacterium]|nr:YdcF family protein [Bacteroidota bacterium]